MLNEQARVEIYIQEDTDVSQRARLMAKLEEERGIIEACFKGGDHHCLNVHYEPDHFSHVTLLDTIKEHGFNGKITKS